MSAKKTPKKVPLWKRIANKKVRVEKLKQDLTKLEEEEVTVEPKMDDAFWKPKFDKVAAMDDFFKQSIQASFDVKKAEWDKSQKKGNASKIAKKKEQLDNQVKEVKKLQDAYDKKRAALRAKIVGDPTDDGRGGIVQAIAMYNYNAKELNLPPAHFVCPGEDFEMDDLAQQHYEDNDLEFVSIPLEALNDFVKKVGSNKFLKTVPVFVSEIVGSRGVKYRFAMGQGKQFLSICIFHFSTFLINTFLVFPLISFTGTADTKFSNLGLIADEEEADPEPISDMSQALNNLQDQLGSDADEDEEPPTYPSGGGTSFEIPVEARKSLFKILVKHRNDWNEDVALGEIELVLDDEDNVFETSHEKFVGTSAFNHEGAAKEMIDIDFIEGLTAEDLIDASSHTFRKKWGLEYSLDSIPEEDEDEEEEINLNSLTDDEEEAASSSSSSSSSAKKRKKTPAKKKSKKKSRRRR